MVARIGLVVVALAVLAVGVLYWLGTGGLGDHWGAGSPAAGPIPAAVVAARASAQSDAASEVGVLRAKQILFGDLHVHSTFSLDAFMMALPTGGGEGAHPVSDACDFARHCAALDFWSINDHALASTPRSWRETIAAIRECDAVGGNGEPDVVPFLGWEWTQIGTTPENHYGHKNVIIRGLGDDEIPARPIAASAPADARDRDPDLIQPSPFVMGALALARPQQDTFDLIRYFDRMVDVPECPHDVPVRDLPTSCRESTLEPDELFAKLDDWGFDSMVIPHGTTWGFYTPAGSAWDKQLGAQHDPNRQTLIEVFSGHGNSEEYRSFAAVTIDENGEKVCPEPTDDYLPSCWRAGEIIEARCIEAGETPAECEARAATARGLYVEAGLAGHLTVAAANVEDWLDSGQCRDCFQPSFNYRPKSSVQYIMALRDFENPDDPQRFEFGFMASSDNHTARPGTGYKEYARESMTEARLTEAGAEFLGDLVSAETPEPTAEAVPFDPEVAGAFFNITESERASSFFLTGGLIGVHAEGRGRDAVWDGMQRKEVYGTSGPRMLLWFDLLNPPGSRGKVLPMGGETPLGTDPIFQVRAVGSLEQAPGCPDAAVEALGPDALQRLCLGECYHPTDQRRQISRIEVVRILPQERSDEPVEQLVEDPWRVFRCDPDPAGCAVTFTDPEFASAGRDALYYVRAIEAPSLAVNADALRCERDASGACLSVNACRGAESKGDDCLAETEERAWSSPIFLEADVAEEMLATADAR